MLYFKKLKSKLWTLFKHLRKGQRAALANSTFLQRNCNGSYLQQKRNSLSGLVDPLRRLTVEIWQPIPQSEKIFKYIIYARIRTVMTSSLNIYLGTYDIRLPRLNILWKEGKLWRHGRVIGYSYVKAQRDRSENSFSAAGNYRYNFFAEK